MLRFWIVVLLVLGMVMGLSCWALGAVLPPRVLGRGRAMMAALDFVSLALFFAGLRWQASVPEGVRRVALLAFSAYWMAKLLFVALVAVACLLRGAYRLFGVPGRDGSALSRMKEFFLGDGTPTDMERRRLLQGAAAFPAAALAASAYGGTAGRTQVALRAFDVAVPGIGDELDGFRIAQLSDIHLGLFFSLEEWRELLEKAAATGADALAVTGDLFDDDDLNAEAAILLDAFVPRFPKGIWFCYGNHEHIRNIRATREALAKTRVRVLCDEGMQVVGGKRPLWFAGVDYPRARSVFAVDGEASLQTAMRDVPPHAVKVLLAHHPDFFDGAAKHGVELVLSGHTHGGQIGLFGVPLVPPVFKYMRGVYRVGPTMGYVHSGNGSWFPYRLGCPPEIAVFALKKKK